MTHGLLIRTPTDLGQTLDTQEFMHCPLGEPNPDIEPLYREAVNSIFSELEYIDANDRELVASFLSSIEVPLRDLHKLGFTIFAIKSKGKITMQNGQKISNWRMAHYFIVPQDAYFRVGKDLSGTIHRFDPNCDDTVSALFDATIKETPVYVWLLADQLERELEGNVPWCTNCC